MSQLLAPETFEFFARYLLAGYVFLTLRSWWIAAERPRLNEQIAEAVILSLINQAILLVTFGWLSDDWHENNASFSLLGQYVIQPAVLGILVGWLAARDWLPSGLRRLFMPGVRPVTDAYEFALQSAPEDGFIIVSYEDGREVHGYFGADSLASEDRLLGGLLIERLYVVGEDRVWIEADPPRSVWLSLKGARSIEFLRGKDDDAEDFV